MAVERQLGEYWNGRGGVLGEQDAHHCPAVMASHDSMNLLQPGQRVRFVDIGDPQLVLPVERYETYHGIVDPFLEQAALRGAMFWVLIKPGLVAKTRHVFDIEEEQSYDDDPCCPEYEDDYEEEEPARPSEADRLVEV